MVLEQHVVFVRGASDAPENLNIHLVSNDPGLKGVNTLTSHFMNSLTYDPKPSMI